MTTQKPISKLAPLRCVVRHQFLEILLRLAEHKYLRSGKAASLEACAELLL